MLTMTKNKPFFSIIIPTLNESGYLPQLLTDLSNQTFQDFEVIVVDGNSDDQTLTLARNFEHQLPNLNIVNSPTRHVCVQRNLGARRAKSNWFIFIDADTRLPIYFLQGLKYHLESQPTDIATTLCKPDRLYPNGQTIATAINLALGLTHNSNSPLLSEGMIIISRKAFSIIHGFDESIDYIEGRFFIKKALKQNLIYTIYPDPKFEYSFRRIKKYGLLNMAARIAKHELSRYLGVKLSTQTIRKLYPMNGGQFFDTPYKNKKQYIDHIQLLFQDLKSSEHIKIKISKFLDS